MFLLRFNSAEYELLARRNEISVFRIQKAFRVPGESVKSSEGKSPLVNPVPPPKKKPDDYY